MNQAIVEGRWKQFKGKVKAQFGKLSDEHLDAMFGKRLEVAGRIQAGYGTAQHEVEKNIERIEQRNS